MKNVKRLKEIAIINGFKFMEPEEMEVGMTDYLDTTIVKEPSYGFDKYARFFIALPSDKGTVTIFQRYSDSDKIWTTGASGSPIEEHARFADANGGALTIEKVLELISLIMVDKVKNEKKGVRYELYNIK